MIRARSLHFAALSVLLAWAFCCLVSGTGMAAPRGFWVDSRNGNDAAAGTSPGQAWRTLDRLACCELEPGDVVSFARGSSFDGCLAIRVSGTAVDRSVLQVTGEKTFRPPYFQIPIQRVSVIASVLRAITCMSNSWRLPTPLQRYRNGTRSVLLSRCGSWVLF